MEKKGVCWDMYGENCSLKGEIQLIHEDDDFVCQECGDVLSVVAETLSKKVLKRLSSWRGVGSIVLLLIGGGMIYWFSQPDITPPDRPVLLSSTTTSTDKTNLKISGEDGAKIYLNNKKLEQKINDDGEATIEIITDYEIGKSIEFSIYLQDDANNSSEKLNFEIEKIEDTTPPNKPTIATLPTKTAVNSVVVELEGEEDARVFVNDNFIGKHIEDGKQKITLDTSGELGEKKFSIYLQDHFSNDSEALEFTIIKEKDKDRVAPSKPRVLSDIPKKYYCDKYSLELGGEKGSDIYINGKNVGVIDTNGRAVISIDISKESSFDITLKDNAQNESEATSFSIDELPIPNIKSVNGFNFAFVPNCRQEVKYQLEPYLTYRKDEKESIYTEEFIETPKPFFIQTVPVTIEQFRKFRDDKNHTPDSEKWDKDENGESNPNYPVTNVSLRDIKEYIKWFNQKTGNRYRLPTIKEWIITINQNLRDNDNFSLRQDVERDEEEVRHFISSLYEFSSTSCKDGVLLLASDYVTDIEHVGKKVCEGKLHQFVTFRLLEEIE